MDMEKGKTFRNVVITLFMIASTVDISVKLYTYFTSKKHGKNCKCAKCMAKRS